MLILLFCVTGLLVIIPTSSRAIESDLVPRVERVWINLWGEGNGTQQLGIALGPNNSVYVSQGNPGFIDDPSKLQVTRYGEDGVVQWEKVFTLSDPFMGGLRGAASDSAGSLYLAGSVTSSYQKRDSAVLRINSNATLAWERYWRGPSFDEFSAVTVDPAGNVVAAGATYSDKLRLRCGLLAKFSPTGNLLWNYTWIELARFSEFFSVAVGPTGNIYVVGERRGHGIHEVLVAKFDKEGQIHWNRTWGAEHPFKFVTDCAERVGGGVVVMGYVQVNSSNSSFFALALDENGNQAGLGFVDTHLSSGPFEITDLWLTALINSGNDTFLAVGSSTERNLIGHTEFKGSLYLCSFDQEAKPIWSTTHSESYDLLGEAIVSSGSNAFYIGGRLGNLYQITGKQFISRFLVELVEPTVDYRSGTPFLHGSIVLSMSLILSATFRRYVSRRHCKNRMSSDLR